MVFILLFIICIFPKKKTFSSLTLFIIFLVEMIISFGNSFFYVKLGTSLSKNGIYGPHLVNNGESKDNASEPWYSAPYNAMKLLWKFCETCNMFSIALITYPLICFQFFYFHLLICIHVCHINVCLGLLVFHLSGRPHYSLQCFNLII